jgi:hypothetical protein
MKLIGDMGLVESNFGLFGDNITVGARLVHGLRKVPQAQESFWMHPMVLLGDEVQVETCFGPFGDSANLDA